MRLIKEAWRPAQVYGVGQADSDRFRRIPGVFPGGTRARFKEEGVHFHSHIDGRKIFMGPEESMQIQSNLASTIAMAFDECPASTAGPGLY